MNNPFSKEDVLRAVRQTLSRVLGISSAEIAGGSRIVDDLGAESLDFVEFTVLLEKGLGLSLPTRSVMEHAGKLTGRPERFYAPRLGLRTEGVQLLSCSPYRYAGLTEGATLHEIFNAGTVENLANICHEILNHLPPTCPACGGAQAVLSPVGPVVCGGCHAVLRPRPGDEVLARWVQAHLCLGASRDAA